MMIKYIQGNSHSIRRGGIIISQRQEISHLSSYSCDNRRGEKDVSKQPGCISNPIYHSRLEHVPCLLPSCPHIYSSLRTTFESERLEGVNSWESCLKNLSFYIFTSNIYEYEQLAIAFGQRCSTSEKYLKRDNPAAHDLIMSFRIAISTLRPACPWSDVLLIQHERDGLLRFAYE